MDLKELEAISDPITNENFILRNGPRSILATFDSFKNKVIRIDKHTAYRISPRNTE